MDSNIYLINDSIDTSINDKCRNDPTKRFIQYISNTTDLNVNNKITLKDIFNTSWDDFVVFANDNNFKIRDIVFEEVEKVMSCGCLSEGYYSYVCHECDNIHYSPFHCHSKFCPSCGVKMMLHKSDIISKKLVKAPHRHLVFTIPLELRNLFRANRKICFDILFKAVSNTLNYIIHDWKTSEKYALGYILTLHTFGRDIKFNPHIHVLFAECATGVTVPFRKISYISYEALRKSFQYYLLKYLEIHFGKDNFRQLKSVIYRNTKDGFYVRALKDTSLENMHKVKDTIEYIIRYSTRPAIAESRIIYFDGEFIKFWYDRHEDGKRVIETIHVFEFFKRLIIHINDKFTNTIRYYGFYCRPLRLSNELFKLFSKLHFLARQCLNSWRNMLRFYFKTDPLICKFCGKEMILESITFKNGQTKFFNSC